MNKRVQLDLANYISRQHYSLLDNLTKRTKTWLRRKHKVTISLEDVEGWIHHIQEIYSVIEDILPKFIKPSSTGFAHPDFIEKAKLEQTVFRKFKNVDQDVVRTVINWVVYYEYLR